MHPVGLPETLEALLFVVGEPVPVETLARACRASVDDVRNALRGLEEILQSSRRGLRVLSAPEGVQLVTAPECAAAVEDFLKAGMRSPLTPAAAETLAIVAYRGPIHRAAVEAIRGVHSSFTLRQLALRGLVERTVRATDSRVYLYQIRAAFLRHLGIASVEELPDYALMHGHEGLVALEKTADSATPPGDPVIETEP